MSQSISLEIPGDAKLTESQLKTIFKIVYVLTVLGQKYITNYATTDYVEGRTGDISSFIEEITVKKDPKKYFLPYPDCAQIAVAILLHFKPQEEAKGRKFAAESLKKVWSNFQRATRWNLPGIEKHDRDMRGGWENFNYGEELDKLLEQKSTKFHPHGNNDFSNFYTNVLKKPLPKKISELLEVQELKQSMVADALESLVSIQTQPSLNQTPSEPAQLTPQASLKTVEIKSTASIIPTDAKLTGSQLNARIVKVAYVLKVLSEQYLTLAYRRNQAGDTLSFIEDITQREDPKGYFLPDQESAQIAVAILLHLQRQKEGVSKDKAASYVIHVWRYLSEFMRSQLPGIKGDQRRQWAEINTTDTQRMDRFMARTTTGRIEDPIPHDNVDFADFYTNVLKKPLPAEVLDHFKEKESKRSVVVSDTPTTTPTVLTPPDSKSTLTQALSVPPLPTPEVSLTQSPPEPTSSMLTDEKLPEPPAKPTPLAPTTDATTPTPVSTTSTTSQPLILNQPQDTQLPSQIPPPIADVTNLSEQESQQEKILDEVPVIIPLKIDSPPSSLSPSAQTSSNMNLPQTPSNSSTWRPGDEGDEADEADDDDDTGCCTPSLKFILKWGSVTLGLGGIFLAINYGKNNNWEGLGLVWDGISAHKEIVAPIGGIMFLALLCAAYVWYCRREEAEVIGSDVDSDSEPKYTEVIDRCG